MILILFLSILSILLPDFDFVSPENPVHPEYHWKIDFFSKSWSERTARSFVRHSMAVLTGIHHLTAVLGYGERLFNRDRQDRQD